MTCPSCGARKARRSCPALGQRICTLCCGTKRLTEIRCPADCPYLASSREHPTAAARRQQEQDLALLAGLMRNFNDRQAELLLAVTLFLARYRPDDLQTAIDQDVGDAAAALAATFETASHGVIYDHRAASLPAERLVARLRPLLEETARRMGPGPPEGNARDAAVVLRRIEGAVRDLAGRPSLSGSDTRRPFLDILERATRGRDLPSTPDGREPDPGAPRLIVP